jgi:hypothetical protein
MIGPVHPPVNKDRLQVLTVGECSDPKQVTNANVHRELGSGAIHHSQFTTTGVETTISGLSTYSEFDGGSSQSKKRPESMKWPVE